MKKKAKKNQNQQQIPPQKADAVDKIVQFVLCQYNIEDAQHIGECDEDLVRELYDSFNTYFTRQ